MTRCRFDGCANVADVLPFRRAEAHARRHRRTSRRPWWPMSLSGRDQHELSWIVLAIVSARKPRPHIGSLREQFGAGCMATPQKSRGNYIRDL
jgi:hypothetical protein